MMIAWPSVIIYIGNFRCTCSRRQITTRLYSHTIKRWNSKLHLQRKAAIHTFTTLHLRVINSGTERLDNYEWKTFIYIAGLIAYNYHQTFLDQLFTQTPASSSKWLFIFYLPPKYACSVPQENKLSHFCTYVNWETTNFNTFTKYSVALSSNPDYVRLKGNSKRK